MNKSTNNHRFVFFADFLGTKDRYSSPPLVIRSRQLLELTIDLYFLPYLDKLDMNIYIFSDTLIVTCPKLEDLLEPISNLFNKFLDFQENKNSLTNLWLRAAISYGEILDSSHLHNHKRIRTIPFLDTSLPHAYSLESIRAGSRIFIDPKIDLSSLNNFEDYFIKWKQITGRGEYAEDVGEFLWPAHLPRKTERLLTKTEEIYTRWKDLLDDKKYSKSEYHKSLIHLDETLKLFIRTCANFCDCDKKEIIFYKLLPKNSNDVIDVTYEWGIWFQAIKGLIEMPKLNNEQIKSVKSAFTIVKGILSSRLYFENFLGELDFPDYSNFKKLFLFYNLDKI